MPATQDPSPSPNHPASVCIDCGADAPEGGAYCDRCWGLFELDLAWSTRGPRP